MTVQKFKYFDINTALAYNGYLTFVVSVRGTGKTYSTQKKILKKWKENGEKFLFLKRRKEEIKITAPKFWDKHQTAKMPIRYRGNTFQIGKSITHKRKDGNDVETIVWSDFGYALSLNAVSELKGIMLDNVKLIIWDEFIDIDNRYLVDEWERILNVLESTGRMDDGVRLVALGNETNASYLPIFDQMGLPKLGGFAKGGTKFKGGEVVVYKVDATDYIEAKKETKLGKVARGTGYYENMIEDTAKPDILEYYLGEATFIAQTHYWICVADKYYSVNGANIDAKDNNGKPGRIIGGYFIKEENSLHLPKYVYALDFSMKHKPLSKGAISMLWAGIVNDRVRFDKITTAGRLIPYLRPKK